MVAGWLTFGLLFIFLNGCSGTSGSKQAEHIRGTQLFTEIFYRLNLQSNDGLMTWSNNKEGDFNHAQIVFGAAVNDYVQGGPYWKDAQWKFVATEVADRYLLVNRAQPNAVLTWAGKSYSGKYVVLYLDHANDPAYLRGGSFRTDALWRVEAEDDCIQSGWYLLFNNRYPNNGIVTWENWDFDAGKKFLQIYTDGSYADYKHSADYLWRFTPIADYVN